MRLFQFEYDGHHWVAETSDTISGVRIIAEEMIDGEFLGFDRYQRSRGMPLAHQLALRRRVLDWMIQEGEAQACVKN